MTPALELKPASIRVSHVTTLHTEVGLGFRVRIRVRIRVRNRDRLGLYLEKYVEMYKKFKRQTSSFYFQIRGSESKGTRWLVLYL